MYAAAQNSFNWQKLRLSKADYLRMMLAGSAWGLAMSAGLTGTTMWNYGMLCPDDIAMTTAISIVAGILVIGPIAAYGGR